MVGHVRSGSLNHQAMELAQGNFLLQLVCYISIRVEDTVSALAGIFSGAKAFSLGSVPHLQTEILKYHCKHLVLQE